MHLTHKITFAASFAILAAALAWGLHDPPREAATPAPAAPERAEPDRAPVLARGWSSDAPLLRRHHARPAHEVEVGVEPTPDEALEPAPPTPDQIAARIDEHEVQLGDMLARGARDEWAVDTERAIGAALETEPFAGTRLLEARCASNLCRVEVGAEEEEGLERFLENAPLTEPFATSGLIRRTEGEQEHVVLYFGRPGFEIAPGE